MSNESALALLNGTPAPSTEAPKTDTPTGAPTPLASTPIAALARKEAALLREKQEFKRQQQELESKMVSARKIQETYENFQKTKAQDPLAALKELGFSEADIFNYMAEQKEPTPEEKMAKAASDAAEAKIKAFEEAQVKKASLEQQERDKQLIASYKGDLAKAYQSDPAKFEYCNYYGPAAEALMYETAMEVVRQSNGQDVLSPQEAAELVESYYEEQDKLMIGKIKKRNAQRDEPTPQEKIQQPPTRTRTLQAPAPGQEPPKAPINKTRTLTNAATGTVASTRLKMNETREQKRDRLLTALKEGKL